MIAVLSGLVIEVEAERVVLDVAGVGYELTCSSNTQQALQLDQHCRVFVHTHVREDALQLFGFSDKSEKRLFLSLIKVNGVGPKMAITILSGAPLARIIDWINQRDVKGLTTLPKVGKKTAEQMILSLNGQLEVSEPAAVTDLSQQIRSALINLGYRASDVESIDDEIRQATDLQQGIRQSLQALSQRLLGEL